METRINNEESKKILENLNLVHYLVKRKGKSIRDEDYDDLASVGKIGLIKAIRTYDESKGIKFTTYASKCINNEIYMYFRKEKNKKRWISYEETINIDGQGDEIKIIDTVKSSSTPIQEMIEERYELEKIINILINVLNKDERTIMLYTILGKKQREISDIYRFSQSYISRKSRKIIEKLRLYNSKNTMYNEKYKVEITEEFYELSINEYKGEYNEFLNFLRKITEQKIKIERVVLKDKRIHIIIKRFDNNELSSIIQIVNLFEEN